MSSNKEYIFNLAQKTTLGLTYNEQEWKKFLAFSGKLHKYSFQDQILIYAQRPDAEACATIDIWNKNMHCWVNKDSKGIALIDDTSKYLKLKYVFDVSDVHKAKYIGRLPYKWELRDEHKEDILNNLELQYGKTDSNRTFENRLLEITERIVFNSYEEMASDIRELAQDSFLEELDDLNLKVRFRELLKSSVAYMVFSRCGLNIEDYKNEFNFEFISEFNTSDIISQLGVSTNQICKPILTEIGKTIKEYDKILENTSTKEYNTLKRESASEKDKFVSKNIGGNENGISKERRLFNSEHRNRRTATGNLNQIRLDEEGISERTQTSKIYFASDVKQTDEAPVRYSAAGREQNGNDDTANATGRGDNGRTQVQQSNVMGTDDEQHPEQSGRNSSGGNRVQQLSLFPSVEEQIGNIAIDNADYKFTDDTLTISDEIIDKVILSGGGEENSRLRIFAKYQKHKTSDEMAEFLKNEYGQGGKGFTFKDKPISVWYDNDGFKFSYGNSARFSPVRLLSWEELEKRTHDLIKTGKYISADEVNKVSDFEKKELAAQAYFFFRDERNELPKELDINYIYPDSEKKLIEYLSTQEGINKVLNCMDKAIAELESGDVKPRLRRIYRAKDIRNGISDLKQTPIEYPISSNVEIPSETFITQDEIDFVLSSGSNIEDGLYRIYDYFKEPKAIKDAVSFLKNEYGIGGRSDALPGNDRSWAQHDYKGLELVKGNLLDPDAKTLISWEKVAKRIQVLIDNDRFLTPVAKLKYAEWKENQNKDSSLANNQDEIIDGNITQTDVINEIEDKTDTLEQIDEIKPIEQSETAKNEQQIKDVKIDRSTAVNYQITNDNLGIGSAKEKYKKNIDAIRTLKQIENENRLATLNEQKLLSEYVGWGGLADVFDENKSSWSQEYQELKSVLTSDEYTAARGSTLNAHYTSPIIINSIYDVLHNLGFKKGNILEPAMGTGNFFGMLPESMNESKLYGVELDDLTGRIAKQLYQKADVKITGFENTNYPNDFFDVAIGNVPFGQYKVLDKEYNKYNLLIHDYFFAKSLDKVRSGGIVAFITSKGTMDKKNPAVRKYLAQKAELLGAIRLPNNAFKANAGTEVTSDILFFKKRDIAIDIEPDWVHLSENSDGIVINDYFSQHPEMILGEMKMVSGPFGMEATCEPSEEMSLEEQLNKAVSNIKGKIEEIEIDELNDLEENVESIPADPNVKNYSFTVVDDKVYYRENSVMIPYANNDTAISRIKGMVSIRNCVNDLIEYQLSEYSDDEIKAKQAELNLLYDNFNKNYGIINSTANKRVFNQDSSYWLLCSLEKLNEDGTLKGKADMFYKRTIKKQEVVTRVDTANEALTVSLNEKGRVDIDYMSELSNKPKEQIISNLQGVIFFNPNSDKWETADEYLSGNVREKLREVKELALNNTDYIPNVKALEQVQPKDLGAADIDVRLGATWIEPKYLNDFIKEVFKTPDYLLRANTIETKYSKISGEWRISGKNADYNNSVTSMSFGTKRVNAYDLLEDALNLRNTKIYDVVYEDGKEKRVINKQETMIASQKQDAIKEEFKKWIFKDQERREILCKKYNVMFNSIRPREFDGSHLIFPGMNPCITLEPHQKNAVTRVLYGDNALLAHCVGAGKTYEMAAAAMESKRLGLCNKSLFVVPNHLTGQWANEFLQLYPGANILATTKKDFEPANRKKFCSRIATGDYDAIIIGHSQFEKIPMSIERQIKMIESQIDEITEAIAFENKEKGDNFSIKQMEKTRKNLEVRLKSLNDETRKDNVINFEQLGIDRLFVDESHSYKNLFLYTKMRNISGIAQTEAKKSSDMFMKCQYLDEITGGKGVTFATGTPISNSMTELYTNMRYLQYDTLKKLGLTQFDSWASTFGETVTAVELSPEGTGYRAKTRFAKFFNLPELINIFKECADIQTPDMLKLPVPEAEYHNEVLKPSEFQKEMVLSFADRAEAVRNNLVEPNIDNMLKITNDGRKLALDQRLINGNLPDEPNSKVNACVENSFKIWNETKDKKSAQLIFCDLSTPKKDGEFNVYDDIKKKLIDKGVPEKEIAFIHDANTDVKKTELFSKVRSGQVRFLLGSTSKMGAGTNIQDKLIALHHLDVPWRPSDIEQQEGRILRKGNENKKVHIFRYITEGTFDSYSWQLIENKQKFISQIMTSKSPVRSCEDIDETTLSYAEVKALATGNPYIKEKMDLDIQVSKLKLLKANYTSQIYTLEDNISKYYPQIINSAKEKIKGYSADINIYNAEKAKCGEEFRIIVDNKHYNDKKEAGAAVIDLCKKVKNPNVYIPIGEYMGFKMSAKFDSFERIFIINFKGNLSYEANLGADPAGNITRFNNALESMKESYNKLKIKLENTQKQLEDAKIEVTKPFLQENELSEKLERLSTLNALLNTDDKPEKDNDTKKQSVMEKLNNIKNMRKDNISLDNQQKSYCR